MPEWHSRLIALENFFLHLGCLHRNTGAAGMAPRGSLQAEHSDGEECQRRRALKTSPAMRASKAAYSTCASVRCSVAQSLVAICTRTTKHLYPGYRAQHVKGAVVDGEVLTERAFRMSNPSTCFARDPRPKPL